MTLHRVESGGQMTVNNDTAGCGRYWAK